MKILDTRIKIGNVLRALTILTSASLIVIGFIFNKSANNARNELDRIHLDPVFKIPIDLSKAGDHSVSFHLADSHFQTLNIFFEIGDDDKKTIDVQKALKRIDGVVKIKDLSSNKVVQELWLSDIDESDFLLPTTSISKPFDNILLPGLEAYLEDGEYDCTLYIYKGDPNYVGKKQFLLAQKLICGMEYLPAAIAGVAALISWGLGCVLILIIAIIRIVKRRRRLATDCNKNLS
jgi:hypothetical protein